MTSTCKFKRACMCLALFLFFNDVTAWGILSRSKSHSLAGRICLKEISDAATVLLAASILIVPAPAVAGDIGKGNELFTNNCASCHIGGSNLVNEKRNLRADALEKYGIGLDQESIQNFVTNNARHKNLVFFKMEGGKLNPTQWEDVTAYISDQAIGGKW